MTQGNLIQANTYTVMGTVTGIYPPATTANGKLRPAILELDSQKYGKCNFAFFQRWENGERTEKLPREWEEIIKVQDWVMGKQIAVTAIFNDSYMDKSNFKNPISIEFLEDTPTLPPEPGTTSSVATSVATPPTQQWTQQQRIAYHGAFNLAAPQFLIDMERWAKEGIPYAEEYWADIRRFAQPGYEELMRGPDYSVEEEPEKQESLFGDISNLQGEV